MGGLMRGGLMNIQITVTKLTSEEMCGVHQSEEMCGVHQSRKMDGWMELALLLIIDSLNNANR